MPARQSKKAIERAMERYGDAGACEAIKNGEPYEIGLALCRAGRDSLKDGSIEVSCYLAIYKNINELTRMTRDKSPVVRGAATSERDAYIASRRRHSDEQHRSEKLRKDFPKIAELNDMCLSAWTILKVNYPWESRFYPEHKNLMVVSEDGFGQAYFDVTWKDGEPEYELLPMRNMDSDYKTIIDIPKDKLAHFHLWRIMIRTGMEAGKRYSHEQVSKVVSFYSGALKVPGELWKIMEQEGEDWKIGLPKI